MSVRAWLRASRLASQGNIALPLLFGQALATGTTGTLRWDAFALVMAFGLADQLWIVWANDVADEVGDRQNDAPTPFSGGSRVLVEGLIPAESLRRASHVAAAATLAIAGGLGWLVAQPLVPVLGVVAIGLLWAYSHPPLRLSWRGGGELLQMAGTGVVLPWIGWLAQGGEAGTFPWVAVAALLPLHLASGVATSLPDEPADRRVGKRTWAVRAGGRAAKWTVALLLLAGWIAWSVVAPSVGIPRGIALTHVAVAAAVLGAAVVVFPRAVPGSRWLPWFVFAVLLAGMIVPALSVLYWWG